MAQVKLKPVLSFLGGTIDAIRQAGQNVADNVYYGLGYTQVVSMAVVTTAWLVVMFPEMPVNPIHDAYAALYNITEKELNTKNVSHDVINYSIWAVGAVIALHVGDRIGRFLWALYCLCRTRCRSYHTMDLPLTGPEQRRVIQDLLPAFTETPELELSITAPQPPRHRRKAIINWVDRVLFFYTERYQNNKKKGKFARAQLWWDVKKNFRLNVEIVTLFQRLKQYTSLVQKRVDFVSRKRSEINDLILFPSRSSQRQSLVIIRDILNSFQRSVVVRHHRRYKQSIYKDVKKVDRIMTEIAFDGLDQDRFDERLKELDAILEDTEQRLLSLKERVPLGPLWLQAVLARSMVQFYQKNAIQLTKEAASDVLFNLLELPEETRSDLIDHVIAQFRTDIVQPDQSAHAGRLFEENEFHSDFYRLEEEQAHSGRTRLIEMTAMNRV